MNFLMVEGRTCKLYRSQEQHHAVESMEGLIPCNGQQDNLIDRFDGRALLDFYREPDARVLNRPKTSDELKLEEVSGRDAASSMHKHGHPCHGQAAVSAAVAGGITAAMHAAGSCTPTI
jgi:arginine/serine-rich splicing factor 16